MRKIRKLIPVIAFVVAGSVTPGWAFIAAVAQTAQTMKDEAYKRFMMIKAIEQLKSLRDNYQASVRYYEMFKRLNEGKGILPNVVSRVGDIGKDTARDVHEQMKDDWIFSKGYGSNVDRTIEKMDQYASDKVRYAGKVFEKSLEAQDEGEKIALEAGTLDSKTTQGMILKTQALQLQLTAQLNANMAQLLDVNTRLYKLQMEEKQKQLRDSSDFQRSMDTFKKNVGS